MDIQLVWGAGEAETALGSFDAALSRANLHNYNLVELSSIVPPDAEIVEVGALPSGRWRVGAPVATVLARETTAGGGTVAAGIGWRQAAEGGVFVEMTGETAEQCERRIRQGLDDAAAHRDWAWRDRGHTRIREETFEDVGTVLVAAVFDSLGHWT